MRFVAFVAFVVLRPSCRDLLRARCVSFVHWKSLASFTYVDINIYFPDKYPKIEALVLKCYPGVKVWLYCLFKVNLVLHHFCGILRDSSQDKYSKFEALVLKEHPCSLLCMRHIYD